MKNSLQEEQFQVQDLSTEFNTTSTKSFSFQDQLHLILALKNFFTLTGKRKKIRHTYFKILYTIYLFTKRCHHRGDKVVYPSLQTISQISGCGRTAVSEFINSPFYKHFGYVHHQRLPNGKNSANIYVLKNWVGKWFQFLERHGFMRGFKTDHKKWCRTFENRLNQGLLNRAQSDSYFEDFCSKLLNADYSEQKRLMNRLSTKKHLKLDAVNPLKPDAIKLSKERDSYKSPIGGDRRPSKENPHSILPKIQKAERILVDEFKIGEIEVHFLMNNTRLSSLQIAINKYREHTSTGWNPNSNVAYFTSLLKKKPPSNSKLRRV